MEYSLSGKKNLFYLTMTEGGKTLFIIANNLNVNPNIKKIMDASIYSV